VRLQRRACVLALALTGLGTWAQAPDTDVPVVVTPDRVITGDAPDKPIGREKVSRLSLWTVPGR